VTPALVGALKSARVFREIRDWDRTSDHVPVMIEFDL
jgi:exonuclease III